MKTQDYLREFITIAFMRRQTILGVTGLALLLGVLIVLLVPSRYQAEGALMLKGSRLLEPESSLAKVNARVNPYREEDLFTEMEILKSQDVAEAAVRRMAEAFDVDVNDIAAMRSIVNAVQQHMVVSLIPRSNVIRVSVQWDDRELAEKLLSNIFDEYLQRRQQVFNPREVEVFYKTQLKTFQKALDELSHRAIELTGGANVQELEDRIARNGDLQAKLRRQLSDLQMERIKQAKQVTFLERTMRREDGGLNFFTTIDSLQLAGLAKRIADLMVTRSKLLQVYDPDSSKVKRADERLKALYAVVRAEAERYVAKERSRLESMDDRIALIKQKLQRLEEESKQMAEAVQEARRLDHERSVIEDSYRTYATRLREAKIRSQTETDRLFKVAVVEAAHVGNRPVFPDPFRVLPMALILGLILGVTLAFIREFFDHRFKRPEDVENYTDLPYLFSVPLLGKS